MHPPSLFSEALSRAASEAWSGKLKLDTEGVVFGQTVYTV